MLKSSLGEKNLAFVVGFGDRPMKMLWNSVKPRLSLHRPPFRAKSGGDPSQTAKFEVSGHSNLNRESIESWIFFKSATNRISLLPSMKWKTRHQGKSLVHEATWDKTNRFFRIYLTDRGSSIVLSVAMIRAGFAESVGIEAELFR